MHTYPLPFANWVVQYEQGAKLATVDIQPMPNESWPVAMKCRSRMHYYLADRQARAKIPAARALLIDSLGRVHDTSTATLIAVLPDGVFAMPPEERILPGISAQAVHDISAKLGRQFLRCDLALDDLKKADELLLASTPFCVLPATQLDNQPIGNGRPGPVFREILDEWSSLVNVDIAAQARRFAVRSKS
jgi:branched-subunit amino acid aminotransferase/4-amino-4-deoxychorismate lyase